MPGPRENGRLVSLGRPAERPPERADAARNRQRVLAAAAALFAEHGVTAVSMDDVALAAGVGKGTLFRRFGDKAGLASALLDQLERELQQSLLDGPPPLGPGAPAADRALAFVDAYLDYSQKTLDLVRMSETATPGARYRIGAYWFWHHHLTILLEQHRRESPPERQRMEFSPRHHAVTAGNVAHVLLAPLAADLWASVDADSWPGLRAAVRDVVARQFVS